MTLNIKLALIAVSFCFATACKKDYVVINYKVPLPKTGLASVKVSKTLLNWEISNNSAADTIYWQYDAGLKLTGAIQNQQPVLSVYYSPNSSNPSVISGSSPYDSFSITFANKRPSYVSYFYKNGSAQDRAYYFNFDTDGRLVSFNEKTAGNDRPINFSPSADNPDSVIFYRMSGGTGLPGPAPRFFTDFTYRYDVSDIPFLPFVLSFPQNNSNFSNVQQGYPICATITDAFIWAQLSPFTGRRMIESFMMTSLQATTEIKASVTCTDHVMTYRIENAQVTNIFN